MGSAHLLSPGPAEVCTLWSLGRLVDHAARDRSWTDRCGFFVCFSPNRSGDQADQVFSKVSLWGVGHLLHGLGSTVPQFEHSSSFDCLINSSAHSQRLGFATHLKALGFWVAWVSPSARPLFRSARSSSLTMASGRAWGAPSDPLAPAWRRSGVVHGRSVAVPSG